MAIAENNAKIKPLPSNIVVDTRATILIRPYVEVRDQAGVVDATKSGMGLPQEITLAQLKLLLA